MYPGSRPEVPGGHQELLLGTRMACSRYPPSQALHSIVGREYLSGGVTAVAVAVAILCSPTKLLLCCSDPQKISEVGGAAPQG
jgi:hypothetical protein